MVPLVGIMFSNIVTGITNYLAYKYEGITRLFPAGWSIFTVIRLWSFFRHSFQLAGRSLPSFVGGMSLSG